MNSQFKPYGAIQRAPKKGCQPGPFPPRHGHLCTVPPRNLQSLSLPCAFGPLFRFLLRSNSTISVFILEPLILILWGDGLSRPTHKHHHSPVCMVIWRSRWLKVATRTSASCTARLAFTRTRSVSRSSSVRRSSSAWGPRAFQARIPGTSCAVVRARTHCTRCTHIHRVESSINSTEKRDLVSPTAATLVDACTTLAEACLSPPCLSARSLSCAHQSARRRLILCWRVSC